VSTKNEVDTKILNPDHSIKMTSPDAYVVAALQVVKAAVAGGELDAQITAASERLREGFKE
jgi:hypothetical protein